jgi:hypothetical protein
MSLVPTAGRGSSVTVPIPKLPTDNLYKFVALSGLFLIALGIYVPGRDLDIALEKWAPIARGSALLARHNASAEKATAEIIRRTADIGARVDAMRRTNAELKNGQLGLAEAKAKLGEQLKEGEKLQKDVRQLEIDSSAHTTDVNVLEKEEAEITADMAAVKLQTDGIKDTIVIGHAIVVVGVVVAVLGFWLWYARVQKFHDAQLAAWEKTKDQD